MVSEIMSVQQAIEGIIETLQKISQDTIPLGHIGVKRPLSEDDLPTVVVSVKEIKELFSGIGNLIGIQKEDAGRISEIRGSKISGIFQVNIWGLSAEKIDEITAAIIDIIAENKADLRKSGFLYLSMVNDIYPSKLSTDSMKEVMVRLIEYQVILEFIHKETFGPDEIIREIKVDIKDTFDEKMTIK
jgi:hypothetical protein